MSGDRREGDNPAPDFDARWRELAAELDQALPPDLQDWAAGSGARQGRADSGHVVWAGDPDADEPDWSGDLADLEAVEGSLDPPAGSVHGPRDWSPPEADEHFEPPDPPPVLGGDPVVVLGWIGLAGGLAVVFAWAMFGALVPAWLARGGLLAIAAGTAALIWKMPHRRDPDDTDDGARV
ncbi:MAG: hypothetical protein LBG60_11005 [Bifidobacteriaceae bacterium]|nr:hypothetical protein [Bifidobacteriaceae bacterium]